VREDVQQLLDGEHNWHLAESHVASPVVVAHIARLISKREDEKARHLLRLPGVAGHGGPAHRHPRCQSPDDMLTAEIAWKARASFSCRAHWAISRTPDATCMRPEF
jgi:hypothetical protein